MFIVFFSIRRMLSKEQHREYRDKERDRDREDRFSRSCKFFKTSLTLRTTAKVEEMDKLNSLVLFSAYAKHSSSRSSRLRWPHDSDNVQSHRRRNEGNFH